MSTIILDEVAVPADLSIFILEDTEIFQKKMIQTLASIGFKGKVSLAGSMAGAVKQITTASPQLILSDWNLPDGKGIDFLKFIRASDQFNNVPFIMVTTMDSVDDILDAVAMGADDYIVKPWEEKEFIQKIASAYKKRVP